MCYNYFRKRVLVDCEVKKMYRLCYYDKKRYKTLEKNIRTYNKEAYHKLIDEVYPELENGNFIEDKEGFYDHFKEIRDKESWFEEHVDHFPVSNRTKHELQISSKMIIKNGHAYRYCLFLKYDVCEEEKAVYLRTIVPRERQIQ